MPQAASGDLTICYETEGDPAGLPLLLVAGLGVQLTWWPAGFRSALADRGFRINAGTTGFTAHAIKGRLNEEDRGIPFAVSGLASAMSSTAVITTYQRIADADWVRPDMHAISRGVFAR